MRVSIILPTFNGHKLINRSIESIFRQSYKDWELVILDDGSSPSIEDSIDEKYLKDHRVHIYRNNSNLGIQKSLNRGISLSRGELIARIDDDDWWSDREKLHGQVRFLESNPEYGMVGTGAIVVDEGGEEIFRYLNKESDREIRSIILQKNPFTHSSVVFRKHLFDELSGYSESLETKGVEDYDLWLRMGTKMKLANLPRYSISFTFRESGSISSDIKITQLKNNLGLINKYKREYRGGFLALCYVYLKLWGYRVYRVCPKFLRDLIFSVYKKS